jgi:hypothetical protein
MFCPTCGRDNAKDKRFCVSCGTNLETVSQALSGSRDDFITKTDMALNQLIARYAERVFKDAPSIANDRNPGSSWKLLGQGILTSFVDFLLFMLMINILPVRFFILLISTPIRMLTGRNDRRRKTTDEIEYRAKLAADSTPERWLQGPVESVSENTTERLEEYGEMRRNKGSEGN